MNLKKEIDILILFGSIALIGIYTAFAIWFILFWFFGVDLTGGKL